ncbi:short neuropeptide F [Hyposmocoma kahamanoa]|uniref:short neuropeptide F n=1 Tax=Hyposmocoma kahamanoa TaxID=1477025 RepID=UPI000E6D7926|nr:short neuropeptide F [Hyposmocoma kahamanoa]
MMGSNVVVVSMCALAALWSLPVATAQAMVPQYETSPAASDNRGGWDALGGLYALLAQHDALGGHALARKSVRSPSRRLRFGRRSDPDMPPQAPLDEMEELMSLRDIRTPVRLRFGRRSEEHAVPHVFPQELESGEEIESPRIIRTPLRLRFGRRSDEQAVPHVFPQEEQDRAVRAPSMRLRFGRRSDNNMFLMPFESSVPKEVKATGSSEDDRQQD